MPRVIKVPVKERSEGALIDSLQHLADEQDEINVRLKELKADETEIEVELIRRFTAQKLEGGRGTLCSVAIQRVPVPKMDDYDKFIAAVKKRGDFHMLERRIAVLAWREYAEKNKRPYPGTTQYERVSLLRSKLAKRS